MRNEPNLDLDQFKGERAARVVARLEGKIDDAKAKLWGEEFAASGGKTPPPVPPFAPAD